MLEKHQLYNQNWEKNSNHALTMTKTNQLASLEAPTYTIAQAARLAGISRGQVKRWLRGYKFKYKINDGLVTVEKNQTPLVYSASNLEIPNVSFIDLIELLFVKEFIGEGFSLQKIRKALYEAEYHLGKRRFARNIFFTDGSNIYLQMPKDSKSIMKLMSGGQWAIPEIIVDLGNKIEFSDVTGLATRWYPVGKTGYIVVDPEIAFGRPIVAGSGISTHNIFDLFQGEKGEIAPVKNWFNISEPAISAAISFEQSLVA